MVLFALSLPVILLFVSFVVDTANWWEHNRHLQMQADAAALAGASRVSVPCGSAVNAAVREEIEKYAGIGGSTYNAQIGGTPPERLHMAVNSKTYPLQASPVDETVVEGEDYCASGMVDVKLTESDVPWFFGIAPSLGIDGAEFINAHARAQIVKVESLDGALPIGVPDVDPKRGKVQFINEDDPAKPVIGEAEMVRIGAFNGLAKWEVPAADAVQLAVDGSIKNIGVRVVMSGSKTSVTCGDPLVECYDAGSANGVLKLRTTPVQQGSGPTLNSVGLRPSNCADAYFTYSSTPCLTGLSADLDFGDPAPVANLGAKVSVVVNNATNKPYNATYANGRWELPATDLFPVGSAVGSVDNIDLKWEQTQGTRGGADCTTGKSNPDACSGTFEDVQRTFAGTDARSGPLRIVKVYDNGLPLGDSSLQNGQHSLTVEVGLIGALQDATSKDSPIVGLRVLGGGSQNQTLDCDENKQLSEELATGCSDGYMINQGTACPPKNDLRASPQPWPCVPVGTGGKLGDFSRGLNMRILGSEQPATCTAPNRWHDDYPLFDPSDPRIVQLFLTPYGAFSGQGTAQTVPVTNFATFYVTGWTTVGGASNPCADAGDETDGGNDAGWIYGRFIKYIQSLPGGAGGGTEACDFDSFGACTMVLTE